MLNFLILPQKKGFLPVLTIPDTTGYFIVAFYAVETFVLSHYAHTCRKKRPVRRVRVLSTSYNLLLNLIKTSERELYRQ